MTTLYEVLGCLTDPAFVLLVFAGAATGLLVGAIPGLSVSMATALLVSVTYGWSARSAMAMIMGVYVVGVFAGAVSAILLKMPGAPSSVVTTLDGYPLAQQGKAVTALRYACVYSFIGTLFGIVCLWLFAPLLSGVALHFAPFDYFLLGLVGLLSVGGLTSGDWVKGLVSAALGLLISCIGLDGMSGVARLTFGNYRLQGGISLIPALIGLFGFAELLSQGEGGSLPAGMAEKAPAPLHEVLRGWTRSLYSCTIGLLVGALPGAGGPVASFLSYNAARRREKTPSCRFGEGAVEGLIASEAANNACIGGALIPMLTLAVPGDAVTAVILSVFMVHGLQPGPLFIRTNPAMFGTIVAGGLLGSVFILLLGLLIAPRLGRLLSVRRGLLTPIVAALCVVGAFACNNRLFDVWVMLAFGILGWLMRCHGYPVAPMTLALALGSMMDVNFRRAISLASSAELPLASLLLRPTTICLLVLLCCSLSGMLHSSHRLQPTVADKETGNGRDS